MNEQTARTLKEIIQDSKQPPVHPTGREKARKAEPNSLLIQVPRMQMIRDKVVSVPLERPKMTTPEKVQAIIRAVFIDLDDGQEHAFIVTLDEKNNYINTWNVGVGGKDHVQINRAELFKRVLATDNAASWIIAHNHPSGECEPSTDDLEQIDILKRGGLYLDRPMRDFIILADGSDKYYSHREATYEL